MTMTNLKTLFDAMKANDAATLDLHGQWRSDLPTFGGEAPADTAEVWSWDDTHMITGTCADDLELEARS